MNLYGSVLLRIYAKCIVGQDERARRSIDDALGSGADPQGRVWGTDGAQIPGDGRRQPERSTTPVTTFPLVTGWFYMVTEGAPGGSRTRTTALLRGLPLPLGYGGAAIIRHGAHICNW